MNAHKHKTFLNIFASLMIVALLLAPSGVSLAQSARPGAVALEETPFSGNAMKFGVSPIPAFVGGSIYQNGGTRLTNLQNTDGGWDWPLDDGNPATGSAWNTVGPIGEGLAEAYLHTSDPAHLAALSKAGAFLLSKTNNFSVDDGYLAAVLDNIFGVTTYSAHVINNFYTPLTNGSYDRNGAGTLYTTAAYVTLIRTNRAGAQANLAAWDLGAGLISAASVGASTAEWIAGVEAEINELDGTLPYDVIGLADAIHGLAYVGVDFDPTSGTHAAAANLADLGAILASYQLSNGGFTWNSLNLTPSDATNQETAYAILALDKLNRSLYASNILAAANYLDSVKLATGGWDDFIGDPDGENNEVTGEALRAISVANTAPVANDDTYTMLMSKTRATTALDGALFNDTDAESDPLTAAVVAAPAHASTFTFNADGTFTYTPVNGYRGTDTFTYKANDGALDSNVATVTITINPWIKISTSVPATDGWILETSENSNVGGSLYLPWALRVGDFTGNRQYRSILNFNTSLPASAVILKVNLTVKEIDRTGNPFAGHGALIADIHKGFFGASSALERVDFQSVATKLNIGHFVGISGGKYKLTLAPANWQYLNLLGASQFRLRFGIDDDNDGIADYVRFYAGEAGLASRPTFYVEYYVPHP